jgi:hypothetical protein
MRVSVSVVAALLVAIAQATPLLERAVPTTTALAPPSTTAVASPAAQGPANFGTPQCLFSRLGVVRFLTDAGKAIGQLVATARYGEFIIQILRIVAVTWFWLSKLRHPCNWR